MAAKIQKVCYLIFLVIGILYLLGSLLLPIGAFATPKGGLFPLLVAIFLIAMSIALLAGFVKGSPGAVEADRRLFPRAKIAIACWRLLALILYSVLLKPIGILAFHRWSHGRHCAFVGASGVGQGCFGRHPHRGSILLPICLYPRCPAAAGGGFSLNWKRFRESPMALALR